MKRQLIGLLIITIATTHAALSQKHLVYFTDKTNTPYTISNPQAYLSQKAIDRRSNQGISIKQRDLPVDPVYVDSLRSLGATVRYTSKWFNAAFVEADSTTMVTINALGFVNSTSALDRSGVPMPSDKYAVEISTTTVPKSAQSGFYGQSQAQVEMLNADVMHNRGFTGAGITIAVHDNGFQGVNNRSAFDKLRNENRILGVYDFVQDNNLVYDNGSHGTMVLSTMAAYLENEIIGIAYDANYYLFVTENTSGENPDEELYWLIAAEHSDSLGVDIINTSLGYSRFDNDLLDHAYSDLDGRTTIVSRASEIAANTGMLIVTSAGNEGANSWHYITAPGDADSIITAGAVDVSLAKTSFSSVGPTADGRIKPDLCALGQDAAVVEPSGSVILANGTSFSSPILAAFAAGFWQAHPELSAQEVIQFLKESASQSLSPDTLLGWGIPDFELAHAAATAVNERTLDHRLSVAPNPVTNHTLQLYLPAHASSGVISIFSATGQLLHQVNATQSASALRISLPKPSFTAGIYLVTYSTENMHSTTSFIVSE